ncbi:MAG: hypothetical protein HC919_03530 [Oscillatoriales cyanobacterium SM2_2_1]|nr:hypothetical protein [Oscillatoriales cyanobacterium SM2_2_1]
MPIARFLTPFRGLVLWLSPSLVPTPVPAQTLPPSLVTAIRQQIARSGSNRLPPFRHGLTDLNGDNLPDAIVLLQSQDWCGSGGCTMLVFRGTATGFTRVSLSTVTGEPIRVTTERRQGWRTLIVASKGRGDVVMGFNGTGYAPNPSLQPLATASQIAEAQVVIPLESPK